MRELIPTADDEEISDWCADCRTDPVRFVNEGFLWGEGDSKAGMSHKDDPEGWRCDALTCREENSELFAGLHAADSTAYYLFDEASARS
jgi:hypothetical protein